MAPLSALCERSDFKLVHLNSRSHNGEIETASIRFERRLQQFSGKIKHVPHFRAQFLEDFSQTLCLYVHFGAVFIDSFSSAKKRCNTSQGFWRLFGESCDRDRFLFPFISKFLSPFFLFLDFIAISDCVFNN